MNQPELQQLDAFSQLPPGQRAPQALYFTEAGLPIHHEYTAERELRARFGETFWLQRPGGLEADPERYTEVMTRIASLCGLDMSGERDGRVVQGIMDKLNAVGASEQDTKLPEYQAGLDEASRILSLTWDRAREEEAFRNQAYYDELTGILNLRGLNNALGARFGLIKPPTLEALQKDPYIANPEAHLEQLRHRELGEPVDVTMFSIDEANFKRLNGFGHHIGDAGLRYAVQEIKSTLRARDAATYARIGGDEFLILIEGMSDDEGRSLQRRINSLQLAKIQAGWSSYDMAWQAAFKRRDALLEAGKKVQASVVLQGEGEDRKPWFCINEEPVALFGDMVVQAVGRLRVELKSWADYEEALKASEHVMDGAKAFIHDAIGADRPVESPAKRGSRRKTDR